MPTTILAFKERALIAKSTLLADRRLVADRRRRPSLFVPLLALAGSLIIEGLLVWGIWAISTHRIH